MSGEVERAWDSQEAMRRALAKAGADETCSFRALGRRCSLPGGHEGEHVLPVPAEDMSRLAGITTEARMVADALVLTAVQDVIGALTGLTPSQVAMAVDELSELLP